MIGSVNPLVIVTYCLSIHGGETHAEVLNGIEQGAVPVRDELVCRKILQQGEAFPLGLRISARAARELSSGFALQKLQDILARRNMFVVTVNGFPYGRFHGRPVKERVYAPDWRSPSRLTYTLQLADILSRLLPEGLTGSLSTVPLAYRALCASDMQRVSSQIGRAVAYLVQLQERTGRTLGLALEPEPDCVMESAREASEIFQSHLFPAAERAIKGAQAPEAARRHLGICLDTCHHAVLGESPVAAWTHYDRAGIRVWKAQLSAALRIQGGKDIRKQLSPFADPIYLHQTVAFQKHRVVRRWPDLSDALNGRTALRAEEYRVHCHVPLGWSGAEGVGTTRRLLSPAFFKRATVGDCPHVEVETYTYSVLPSACRNRGLTLSIADELEWVVSRMPRRRRFPVRKN